MLRSLFADYDEKFIKKRKNLLQTTLETYDCDIKKLLILSFAFSMILTIVISSNFFISTFPNDKNSNDDVMKDIFNELLDFISKLIPLPPKTLHDELALEEEGIGYVIHDSEGNLIKMELSDGKGNLIYQVIQKSN